ncbi:hypothetical protein [Mucilaginibacter glaciei]|uniref:DUF1320 domain-containing protein n=1 Tax=Mucilaginibacter glaciei TaxID=2772109 RepID=A0A926S1P6_9SPHI|nr:hypothetical protein [Mucilaginibacter glaciei]MBD1394270.1 hypothetical protein [Mucilaginibacter glaciei]
MAFLEKTDFSSVIRMYELDTITANDDTLVDQAIEAAIEEVSGYFVPNDKKQWDDGRPHYDVEAIFNATGTNRNALMMANTKIVAIWHLLILCNTGFEYEEAKDRYDRSTTYLKKLGAGEINSRTLPRITVEPPEDELPFQMGSRPKFNHE